jgi:SAM-dependent methyltransferase
MTLDRPLRIATGAYYWKPGMAWFRALELDTYRATGAVLSGPILDLGCGDGRVAGMLRELGVVRGQVFGIDPSSRQLAEADRVGAHEGIARADGGRLPFPDATFAAVFCNGSLTSIPDGPDDALREVCRVLVPGGMFLATFPTDRFLEVLLVPRLLAFWPDARQVYERRMSLRQPHFTADSPADWTQRFAAAGLEIERSIRFFSSRAGEIWNLLSMHLFRFVGALRLLPGARGPGTTALARALEGAYEAERSREGEGYILVVARRAEGPRRSEGIG